MAKYYIRSAMMYFQHQIGTNYLSKTYTGFSISLQLVGIFQEEKKKYLSY